MTAMKIEIDNAKDTIKKMKEIREQAEKVTQY